MSRFRFRDNDSSTSMVLGVLAGALVGIAAGVFLADRLGGVQGISKRLRRRAAGVVPEPRAANDFEELDDFDEDELDDDGVDSEIEVRVLEAFRNDPILGERAVDIGSIGEGVVELAGWVDTEQEAHHAVTLARGVPGVDTVVNRLAIGEDEDQLQDAARRFAEGDASLTEAHWDGNTVGTGRRRQGRSDELDRHADPRVDLEERWSSAEQAVRDAADPVDRGPSRGKAARGVRAPVPRADHVDLPVDGTGDAASRTIQ